MHLAQVVSFVSLCATRTWKNWKTPSTLKLSLTECAGVDYDYNWGLRHGKYTVRSYPVQSNFKSPVASVGHAE